MGGLLRTDSTKTITKLPILGDIPLIGAAFRHKDKETSDRELIIFITPHIINDTEAKTTVARSQKIRREQEAPSSRLREVEQNLSEAEARKL